jgi:hypothetical protein
MTQYLPLLAIFAMVLSPLYPPVTITLVHWLKTRSWRRPTLPTVKFAIRRNSAARSIAVEPA